MQFFENKFKHGLHYPIFVVFFLIDIHLKCVLSKEAKFEKDHGMNTQFPPVIQKPQFEGIPLGHLRSLGYQKASDGPITELKTTPNPADFFNKYVNTSEPVSIRNCVDRDSPIMASWTDDKLRDSHGDVEVDTIEHKETVDVPHKRMPLSEFLETYTVTDVYMATIVPHEMASEIMMPTFMQCGPISRALLEAEIWMAHGGAGSLLHYHADHQVHCLVDGRKDFILINPTYKKQLHCVERPPNSGEGYSKIDTEFVNMFEYPELHKTPWTYTTLLTGDCIFIPAGYLHQVRSYGRSLSYTIQFAPTLDNDVDDCRKMSLKYRPLSSFSFLWTSKKGIEQMANEKISAEDLRGILQILMRNDTRLTFEQFDHFYTKAIQKSKKKVASSRTVFNNLDPNMKGYVERKSILEFKKERLEKVVRILNNIHHEHHDEL